MTMQKNFALRLDEVVYERIKKAASSDGVSINTFILQVLTESLPPEINPFGLPMDGRKAALTFSFEDPVNEICNVVDEVLRSLLEDMDRLVYWQNSNQRLLELLLGLQKELRAPRDLYLAAVANQGVSKDNDVLTLKSKKFALTSLAAQIKVFEDAANFLEKTRRRRGKELTQTLSNSESTMENLGKEFVLIEKKLEKESKK